MGILPRIDLVIPVGKWNKIYLPILHTDFKIFYWKKLKENICFTLPPSPWTHSHSNSRSLSHSLPLLNSSHSESLEVIFLLQSLSLWGHFIIFFINSCAKSEYSTFAVTNSEEDCRCCHTQLFVLADIIYWSLMW